jgi:hypothetical protein
MKILIVDCFLAGQKNSDWKEGYEFYYAFKNLGYDCDIAGRNGIISEDKIPLIANKYDLIIITENYPQGWRWWDWRTITTPKLFWAIDTHIVNYLPWIQQSNIDIVAFNNPGDMKFYPLDKKFEMPYASSRLHHMITYTNEKKRDIVFIGSMNEERKYYCDKFNITNLNAYGPDYMVEMQSSKICFNHSMNYNMNGSKNINAKFFEIMGSGTFMLSNYVEDLFNFFDKNEDVEKMLFRDEEELSQKINFYLKNDLEREKVSKKVFDYIYNNHTYENRAKLIIDKFKEFYS